MLVIARRRSGASSGPARISSFNWDGDRTAEWFEDISPETGALSSASSSPVWGVVSWPDGNYVVLTYTWGDFGMRAT